MERNMGFSVGLAAVVAAMMVVSAFGAVAPSKAEDGVAQMGIAYLRAGEAEPLLASLGVETIHQYDGFMLASMTPAQAAALTDQGITANVIADRTTISFGSYLFDTLNGEPEMPENLRIASYAGEGLYLLQFIGPVDGSWLRAVGELGVEVFGYIPNYAYIVRASAEQISGATSLSFVQWAGIYQPAYKIAPGLVPGLIEVRVIDGPTAPETVQAIDALSEVRDYGFSESTGTHDFLVLADYQGIVDIANLADVSWLEQYAESELFDETSSEITGGIWTANTPYGAYGNYANIAGYDGSNIIVAVADTGLGNGAAGSAGHVDFTGRVVGGQYYGTLTTWADGHGHGTHCSGIVAANGNTGTGTKYGSTNYYCGAGVAYDARLFAQKFFTDGGAGNGIPTTSAGWDTFFQHAYNAGAYVHSNSWGANTGGAYSNNDLWYDAHVRDSATSTTGQQPLIITVAAGNAGSSANTVGTPGCGKNVITVGATESYHTDANTYGDAYDAVPADVNDPNTIIYFSSRGLRDDTGIKPDVAAPGTGIVSTHSPNAGNNLYGYYTPDNRYEWCSGTSQANPHIAGASAVIVDWWQTTHSGANPMPAMVKALLINTAIDIGTADIPNGNEGWGRAYLPTIVSPPVSVINSDNPQQLSTGQTYTTQISYQSSSYPLKISMVYTDAPGTAGSNPTLVNNLNLRVTAPGGQIYYGNAYANGYSVSGTAASNAQITGENWDRNADNWDDVNNIECVYIPTGSLQAGTYTVEVIGYSVTTDVITGGAVDQDFAITMYNAVPASTGATATATGPIGGPTNDNTVTLTYTYTGTPTSVNLYRTTNGGTTWALCGNDASVDGSYAYTISSGSGTYGWLASAVGGSSTEPSPPAGGTAPEAASYILDMTAPAAVTGLTVEHYGAYDPTPVVEGFQASSGASSTSYVLTPPSGIAAGELLLLIVENDHNAAGPEFNAVAGWTKINEAGSATPDAFIAAYYRIADGTEGSVTVTVATARAWVGWYIRISGASTASPINVQNFAVSTGAGVNPHVIPAVTTTTANCLAIYGLSLDGGDGDPFSVSGTGWTESAEGQSPGGTGAADVSGCWGTKVQATAGSTGTASVTCAVTDGASYFQLAVAPSGSTGGTLDDNTLNWTHSGTDVDHYNIYRDADGTGSSYSVIDTVPVGTNTYCDIDRGQADAVLWWYRVRAVDAAGNEETNTNSVQEPGWTNLPYEIDLTGKFANSWVFVSFPSAMSGNILTILNDATAGDGQTAWTVAKWYNAQTPADPWKTYRVGSTVNDLSTISSTMGVWLWITANGGDQALTLSAYAAPSATAVNVNLYTGWNMVGYPSMTARLGSATLPAQADRVSVWQAASPYITDSVPGSVTLSHGNAYWVHVTADCTWTVNP